MGLGLGRGVGVQAPRICEVPDGSRFSTVPASFSRRRLDTKSSGAAGAVRLALLAGAARLALLLPPLPLLAAGGLGCSGSGRSLVRVIQNPGMWV